MVSWLEAVSNLKANWSIPKGRFFWCVPNALIHCCLHWNMPKACPFVVMRHRLLWLAWIIAYYQGSHGFNEIQRDDYLWEFVADYLEHRLHGLYGYVGFVESCWICVRVFCLLRGESSGFMNLWEWGCSRRGCFLPFGGRFLSCARWRACSFVCSSHSRRSAP